MVLITPSSAGLLTMASGDATRMTSWREVTAA